MFNLREEILQLEVETAPPVSKRFIPQRHLEKVLGQSAIDATLSGREFQKNFAILPELTLRILEGGRKLFGTLILIQRVDAIFKFHETGPDREQNLDSRLPIRLDELETMLDNAEDATKFHDAQYKFLSPILQKDKSHHVFNERVILPFIACMTMTSGGFGEIQVVTLCPWNQQLVSLNLDGKVRRLSPPTTDLFMSLILYIGSCHPKEDISKEH